MSDERPHETGAPPGETEKMRVDRELIEFLNELRVVLPGVQVLFAFLLTLPFTSYWPEADPEVRVAYVIAFYSIALAAVLMMTVSSFHRLRFRQGDKERILRASNRLIMAGIACLAVGMVAVSWMISEILFAQADGQHHRRHRRAPRDLALVHLAVAKAIHAVRERRVASSSMRVAICQMNSGADVERNLATAERLVREAADGGADLASLPEYLEFMGPASRRHEVAQPIPGPVTDRLGSVARSRSMWVLAGGLLEAHTDHVYDTSVLIDREGEIAASYRKIHLFDVALPDQPPIQESATITAGDQLVTHVTETARVGLSICYDLRFPELYRGLMAQGAEVLFVPAQFQHSDREGSLAHAAACPRDREPVLRGRARSVWSLRRTRGGAAFLRPFARGRSMGPDPRRGVGGRRGRVVRGSRPGRDAWVAARRSRCCSTVGWGRPADAPSAPERLRARR